MRSALTLSGRMPSPFQTTSSVVRQARLCRQARAGIRRRRRPPGDQLHERDRPSHRAVDAHLVRDGEGLDDAVVPHPDGDVAHLRPGWRPFDGGDGRALIGRREVDSYREHTVHRSHPDPPTVPPAPREPCPGAARKPTRHRGCRDSAAARHQVGARHRSGARGASFSGARRTGPRRRSRLGPGQPPTPERLTAAATTLGAVPSEPARRRTRPGPYPGHRPSGGDGAQPAADPARPAATGSGLGRRARTPAGPAVGPSRGPRRPRRHRGGPARPPRSACRRGPNSIAVAAPELRPSRTNGVPERGQRRPVRA